MPRKSYDRKLDEHLHILVSQGNHEAYHRLAKRYRSHSALLCREILTQYPKTNANFQDLLAICNDIFPIVVRKFENGLSSFFTYWREKTKQRIIDYLIDCDDNLEDADIRFIFSLDDQFDNRHAFSDYICEKDEDRYKRRLLFETRNIIARNEKMFSPQEVALLNLALEGYSIGELEHSGLLKRSALYLTFKDAIDKLRIMIRKTIRNNP